VGVQFRDDEKPFTVFGQLGTEPTRCWRVSFACFRILVSATQTTVGTRGDYPSHALAQKPMRPLAGRASESDCGNEYTWVWPVFAVLVSIGELHPAVL
jgi:hypothetical protein